MEEKHKTLCENLFKAAGSFLKDDGYLNQSFFILKGDTVNIVVLPKQIINIEDPDQRKHAEFSTAMQLCRQMQGEAVIHVGEAWTVDGTKEELENFKGQPSEHPNRRESVTIIYMHISGENHLLSGHVIHLHDSNQKILENPQWITITDFPLIENHNKEHRTLH